MPQTSYIVATPQGPQFADTGFFLSDVLGNRYPTDKERLENHPGLTQAHLDAARTYLMGVEIESQLRNKYFLIARQRAIIGLLAALGITIGSLWTFTTTALEKAGVITATSMIRDCQKQASIDAKTTKDAANNAREIADKLEEMLGKLAYGKLTLRRLVVADNQANTSGEVTIANGMITLRTPPNGKYETYLTPQEIVVSHDRTGSSVSRVQIGHFAADKEFRPYVRVDDNSPSTYYLSEGPKHEKDLK